MSCSAASSGGWPAATAWRLQTGTGVEELIDSADSVHVRLSDGTAIEADIAVVGVGTAVNVEWLLDPATPGHSGWETGVTCDGAGTGAGSGSVVRPGVRAR